MHSLSLQQSTVASATHSFSCGRLGQLTAPTLVLGHFPGTWCIRAVQGPTPRGGPEPADALVRVLEPPGVRRAVAWLADHSLVDRTPRKVCWLSIATSAWRRRPDRSLGTVQL